MSKYKPITDHKKAAHRFLSDLAKNDIITYNIYDFSADVIPSVYPAGYLNKCTHATVAISGSAHEAQDYLVICPFRVDRDSKAQRMVYDIDPLIITLDSFTAEPAPVAIIGYHQNFPGRTTPIAEFAFSDIYTTVALIQKQIITTADRLDNIPLPVEHSLKHMADYFRNHYGIE